jgi:hypothetical protein
MNPPHPHIRPCLEPLEDRVLLSAAPAIQMTFATTTDSRTVSVNYTINNASLAGQNVSFNIYRSSGYNSLSGAQLLGAATIPASDSADLSLGSHTGVKLSLTAPNGQPVTALTPNTALPFIVVVADTDGSTASFETHVLGVIVSGLELDPQLLLLNQVPAWETQMAAALQQSDGYEAVIPFNWVRLSILPFPQAIQLAAGQLYQQIVAESDQLASQHPGDVVDINFIGHSRGTLVISDVLQELNGTSDPALRGGYMEMTLLDPHPANLTYGQFSWASLLPGGNELAALVALFELLAQDAQVIVPSNVEQTLEFDQQTPAEQLGFPSWLEIWINLWGEVPGAIPNQSIQPIEAKNLTDLNAPGIGLVGHFEVPEWYLANVVDANETFDYFG